MLLGSNLPAPTRFVPTVPGEKHLPVLSYPLALYLSLSFRSHFLYFHLSFLSPEPDPVMTRRQRQLWSPLREWSEEVRRATPIAIQYETPTVMDSVTWGQRAWRALSAAKYIYIYTQG